MLADSFLMVLDHDNSKLVQYLEHAATAGLPLMITVSVSFNCFTLWGGLASEQIDVLTTSL